MPQFDILIINNLIVILVIILFFYYQLTIFMLIKYIQVKKFRIKIFNYKKELNNLNFLKLSEIGFIK